MSDELNESDNEMEIGENNDIDDKNLNDSDGDLSSDDSADSDSGDDADEPLLKNYIEILQAITQNRYVYNNYTNLIDSAHKLNDLDKIRESCNLFASVFPIAPEIWLKWILIELKVSSNVQEYENVQKLFRRALRDYYSTEVAIEYGRLAILWDNDEIWNEIIPKYAFNCLKGSQLFQERRNHFQIKLDDSPENIKKMIKIYQAECRLPLLEIENVYKEFKEFAQKFESISETEIDWETVDRRYNRASSTLSKILPFELKLKNLDAKKYGEKERLYLEYIKECEDLFEDDFLQAIYERMVTDCCLSSTAWFEYMKFIDSIADDSDEEEGARQSMFGYTKLEIIERALRNITWNAEIYIEKLRTIENGKPFEKSKYQDTFEAAIASGFDTPEPLVQIWLEYLTHMRRNTDFKNDAEIEILRKNFDLAWTTLGRQWGVLADQQCEILQFWGYLEYTTMGNMLKGRELWTTVMESGDNSYKTALWIKFIDFEQTRNIESARKLYNKAISVPNLDNVLSLQTSWLNFERVYGNASTLKACETLCRKIYASYSAALARSQKREAKTKSIVKPEVNNKRPYPESSGAAVKKPEAGESQPKKMKTISEPGNTGGEVDETKEHLTVFLSNLDYKITDPEISSLFPNFKIQKISLPQDEKLERGRGYGYVEFSNENEVRMALELDRTLLNGRPTYISPCNRDKNAREKGFKFSQEIEPEKLFVKGVPYEATQEDLEELFKKCGELKSVRIVYHKNGKSKGIAYIEYKNEKSASKAVLEMDQKEFRGHVLVVAISAPPPRPSSSRFEIPFKRITKSAAIGEMKPRLSLIPQAVQKRILQDKRVVPMDVSGSSPPEMKTNDYFKNLANRK